MISFFSISTQQNTYVNPIWHQIQKVGCQSWYQNKILGVLSTPLSLYINEDHKKRIAKNIETMRKERDEQRLDNLKQKEKKGTAGLRRVIHNDVKHAFFSLIIKLGNKVSDKGFRTLLDILTISRIFWDILTLSRILWDILNSNRIS